MTAPNVSPPRARQARWRSRGQAAWPASVAPGGRTGQTRAWWNALTGALGTVAGLAPHVLHHIGLLAGTAFIAGAGGTALFGILGLALSVPMLLRLRRRFASWWARPSAWRYSW
jgi:hypothetical protein